MKHILLMMFVMFGLVAFGQTNKRITVKQAKIDSVLIWQGDTIDFTFFEDTARIDTLKFTDLYDSPSSYTASDTGKVISVNTSYNAIEFKDVDSLRSYAYGELYISGTQSLDLSSSADVDSTVSPFTISDTIFCKADTSYLLPRINGIYDAYYSLSIDPNAADTVLISITSNHTAIQGSVVRAYVSAFGQNITGGALINITTSDTIRLKIRSMDAKRYDIYFGNFRIVKIK